MWGWYSDAANRPPPPAHMYMEILTAERAELYPHIPPLGDLFP